jgi:hypothetical protein
MLHHQISGLGPVFAIAANWAVPHCCTSGDSGEPVVPSARMRDRSPTVARSTPAFMQLAKKAAPAPKKVTPARRRSATAWSSRAASLLPPGLPSKITQVVPLSRPLVCAFHITQPVELYQW